MDRLAQKPIAAILVGTSFVCAVLLLVSIPIVQMLAILILFMPGGMLASIIGNGNTLTILALNVLIYSGIAYPILVILWRKIDSTKVNRIIGWLAALTLLLVGLSCIPALNILWPHHMIELARQETELQNTFFVGMDLNEAQAILKSKGFQFGVVHQSSSTPILKGKDTEMVASPGDTVVWARVETDAYEFPCGYNLQIHLLFDTNKKLKQKYIHRWSACL